MEKTKKFDVTTHEGLWRRRQRREGMLYGGKGASIPPQTEIRLFLRLFPCQAVA